MFSRQCLGKRRIPDLTTLRREAAAWNRRVNRELEANLTTGDDARYRLLDALLYETLEPVKRASLMRGVRTETAG